jgi:predicted  nucleic acid-binding Zn-ribbon protein
MSVDLEKIQKEIDRLKRQIHEDTKDLCNIFTSLNAIRHRLDQQEEILRDFNERFWDLLIIICPESRIKESNTELFSTIH